MGEAGYKQFSVIDHDGGRWTQGRTGSTLPQRWESGRCHRKIGLKLSSRTNMGQQVNYKRGKF